MGAPADAIRGLIRALAENPITARPRHVRDDIAALRRAFQDDEDFARALRAVIHRLRTLGTAEAGAELDHDLEGWRRLKFSSGVVDRADLRIIFRPDGSGFELRAFGHRHEPESLYFRAAKRP